MNDGLLIRRVRKSELRELAAFCNSDEKSPKHYPNHSVWSKQALDDVQSRTRVVFGAFSSFENKKEQGRYCLVACIFLKRSYDDAVEFKNLVVSKHSLTRGVARKVVEKAVSFCDVREIRKIEIELPQSEIKFISLFLSEGFRVVATREKYKVGQLVCVLERSAGQTYQADPFDYGKLGKWFLRSLVTSKISEPNEDNDHWKSIRFEVFPGHPSFSHPKSAGFFCRPHGTMLIMDDVSPTDKVLSAAIREPSFCGALRYVFAKKLPKRGLKRLEKHRIWGITGDVMYNIAGKEQSSLRVPFTSDKVAGVLTVLEWDAVASYSDYSELIYYLISGIGAGLPLNQEFILVIYCPRWIDGGCGVIGYAKACSHLSAPFEKIDTAFKELPKALSHDDLEFYRTYSTREPVYAVRCTDFKILLNALPVEQLAVEKVSTYVSEELNQKLATAVYLDRRTCKAISEHIDHAEKFPKMKATIVELDLIAYSDAVNEIEQHFSAEVVTLFNEQIEGFILSALSAMRKSDSGVVRATTGDGAIVSFTKADDALFFAKNVLVGCQKHNKGKTHLHALRRFRIGIATGEFAVKRTGGTDMIAGLVIARAVRLEHECQYGEIIVDRETFDCLSESAREGFKDQIIIPGKRDEKFFARRLQVFTPSGDYTKAIKTPAQTISEAVLESLYDKLKFMKLKQVQAASHNEQYALKCEIDSVERQIIENGGKL